MRNPFRRQVEAPAPSLRDRADTLRASLSRRDVTLGAAVVAAVPLPVMAAPVAADHPDAELIALWQRWEEARRIERAALARWDTIPNARDLIDTPEALSVQPDDDALGIANLADVTHDGRLWYCVGNPGSRHRASVLREPRRRNRIRPPVPSDNLPTNAWAVVSGEPWPEAQARADAIVAAWDWYEAETARLNEASGHDAAEREWQACDGELGIAEDDIMNTQARNLAGLTIKARIAHEQDARGDRVSTDLLFEIVRGLVALDTPTA